MYQVKFTTTYKKSYKLMKKRGITVYQGISPDFGNATSNRIGFSFI